jgi:multiple sugar transport system substrate-binding protein
MKLRKLISAATLMSLLLVACGGEQAAQGTPAPEEAVDVTFWHANSGVLGEQLQKLIDKFNATHKTKIKAEFKGGPGASYTPLFQAIVASLQAGSPPDMAQVPAANVTATYMKAKALEPVQKYVDSPDGYTKDQLKDFYPAFLDDNRLDVDGKPTLVSWPLSKSMQVLYYNPGILQQAGVSVPKTWNEFREALKTVKQKVPSVTPLMYTAGVYYFWLPLLRDNGGDLLTKNLDKAAFNTDAGRAALQYQVDLTKVDKTAVVTTGFNWQNPFAQGKVAFAISTSVSRPFIEQAMPAAAKFEVGVAPLPAGEKKANNTLFGNNLVIFKKAPESHKRGAWIFMKWMSEVDQTAAWSLASGGGYMVVRKSAASDPELKKKLDQDPRLRVPLDALKDSTGSPPSPDLEKITPKLDEAITKALEPTGGLSVKAALDQAEKKVNDILKGE